MKMPKMNRDMATVAIEATDMKRLRQKDWKAATV